MIHIPTLFILGAGASKPYGYPTGTELRVDIINSYIKHFNSLNDVKDASLGNVPRIRRGIENFVKIFSKSSLTSIDKFLSLNPNLAPFGKIGIELSILNSEKRSRFRQEMRDSNGNENTHEDWYTYLFNRMIDGLKNPDDYKKFNENKVAFITFNYDRSLEHFIYDSFYNAFYQSHEEITLSIEKPIPSFPIIHVYGIVAPYEITNWPEHNYGSNFDNYLSVENMSKGIRVIGEDRAGEDMRKQVKQLLTDFKRIFFLGFSYAQENLDVIELPNNIDENWNIFGTAMGMTKREIIEARGRINSNFTDNLRGTTYGNPRLENLDSCALLREYL